MQNNIEHNQIESELDLELITMTDFLNENSFLDEEDYQDDQDFINFGMEEILDQIVENISNNSIQVCTLSLQPLIGFNLNNNSSSTFSTNFYQIINNLDILKNYKNMYINTLTNNLGLIPSIYNINKVDTSQWDLNIVIKINEMMSNIQRSNLINNIIFSNDPSFIILPVLSLLNKEDLEFFITKLAYIIHTNGSKVVIDSNRIFGFDSDFSLEKKNKDFALFGNIFSLILTSTDYNSLENKDLFQNNVDSQEYSRVLNEINSLHTRLIPKAFPFIKQCLHMLGLCGCNTNTNISPNQKLILVATFFCFVALTKLGLPISFSKSFFYYSHLKHMFKK